MKPTVVEELAIALSVDVEGLKKGLAEIARQMAQATSAIQSTAGQTGEAMGNAGQATADAANKGGKAMGQLGEESKKAGNEGKKALGGLRDILQKVRKEILPLTAALAGAFGTAKLFNEYVNRGDSLKKLSRQTGMSIADLDAWGKATEAAGGKADALFSTLQMWYQKTGRPAEAFLRFGEAVEGMSEREAQRLLKLYGVADDAIPIFIKGQAEAQKLYNRYRETAFTQQDADNARAFKVAWMDFGVAAQSFGNVLLRTVVPVLTKLLNFLSDIVKFVRENMRTFEMFGTALGLVFGIKTIKAAGGLLAVVSKLGIAFKTMLLPIIGVGAAIAALVLTIDDLMTFVEGGDSLFERVLKDWGMAQEEIDAIRQGFAEIGNAIGALWDAISPFLKGFAKGFLKGIVDILVVIIRALGIAIALSTQISNAVVGAVRAVVDAIAEAIDWIVDLPERVSKAIDDIKKSVSEFFGGKIIGGIKSIFGIEDDKEPSSQAQSVAVDKLKGGNTVNTNTEMNNVINVNTSDNPQAVARAVDKSLKDFGHDAAWLALQSQSGTMLKPA